VPGLRQRANVTAEIQQLRLPHGNSDLPAGAAWTRWRPPAREINRREVYILTDMQKTFFLGG